MKWQRFSIFFLLTTAAIAGCKKKQSQVPDSWGDAHVGSHCRIIRSVQFNEEAEIWLLDICPSDERITELDYAINIAPDGEPTVTTYIDTIQRFSSVREAKSFASENGIQDVVL